MTTSRCDELATISLPIGQSGQMEPVLVHIIDRGSEYIRVILCDIENAYVDESIAGPALPASYSASQMGSFSALKAHHPAEVDELILAGVMQHGDLTLARSLLEMTLNRKSPEDALTSAVQQSLKVAAWQKAIEQQVHDLLM